MSFKQITRIRFFTIFTRLKIFTGYQTLQQEDFYQNWSQDGRGDRALVLGHGSIAIGHFVIK